MKCGQFPPALISRVTEKRLPRIGLSYFSSVTMQSQFDCRSSAHIRRSSFNILGGSIYALAFSRTAKYLAIGNDEGQLEVRLCSNSTYTTIHTWCSLERLGMAGTRCEFTMLIRRFAPYNGIPPMKIGCIWERRTAMYTPLKSTRTAIM